MYKYQILIILILFQLIRALFFINGKSQKYLLLSFFIITIPFEFSWPIYAGSYKTVGGTLGSVLNVTIPLLLVLIMPLFGWKNKSNIKLTYWYLLVGLFILISLINPFSSLKSTSLFFGIFIMSHSLFFIQIFKKMLYNDIILGFFDGFSILCIIQFILAICFPLLGMSKVTTLFHLSAGDWSTRMDSRVGAVGTFVHPGNLALFITIASAFFLGCYLSKYKKKMSLFFIGLNLITLFLTFSRTVYLSFLVDILFIYYIFLNAHKNIFALNNLLKFIIPLVCLIIYIVYYSPVSDIFLKSDADDMLEARLLHFYMGYQAFLSSPIIGVGINSHLEYFYFHTNLFNTQIIDDFLWNNPIHNTHIIILVETGIIGLVSWIAFVFESISKSKQEIACRKRPILAVSQIGLLMGICIYGMSGWAPLSSGILPFILLFSFFSIQFRTSPNKLKYLKQIR
ncbi:O-antigen ligase family protein [Aquirufa sp. LEPPI-3A]|uniref:O-antigen ligase family protein n=1 Tax=Aquirufa regiilacus TaxID=3024868 RepID=UPI0028DE4BF3|nr:O-antigen ligase family protein [Aquirufa sp. LEPPI-3A]MDT8887877.1 O-antigen ligase family protein [Aquirufa sp. LEPPI-3A]